MYIDGFREIEIPSSDLLQIYRAQPYPKDRNMEWSPFNFTSNPHKNRWTPLDDSTYYASLHPITSIVESFTIFRQAPSLLDIPPGVVILGSELKEIEVITLELSNCLRLLDFTNGGQTRHRIDSPIDKIRDLSLSNKFSTLVYNHTNLDGLYYNTRFGGESGIVVYGRAKNKIMDAVIIKRESMFNHILSRNQVTDIERQLNCRILIDY